MSDISKQMQNSHEALSKSEVIERQRAERQVAYDKR